MPRPKFFDCYDCGGITGDHYGFGPFVDQEIAQSQSSIPNFRELFIPVGTPSGVSYVSERLFWELCTYFPHDGEAANTGIKDTNHSIYSVA